MTPCSPTKKCRRQMMLAAVAATVLLLTVPQNARAQDGTAAHEMADTSLAAKEGKKLPPVSDADIAKAKTEIEKLRGMPQSERVDYLVDKRENANPADFEARKNEMRARKAYIKSLPEAERKTLKEQMKADRTAAREKMKAKWDAMTPAERDAVKAKRKAEFDKLPEDVKAKIKAHRAHGKDHNKDAMKDHHTGDHERKTFEHKNDVEVPAAPVAQ